MREATRIVSTNPAIAQGHAERFLASQGLNPGSSVASSAASIRGGYDKEQSHQVHAVTRQSMDDVRANASSMGSSTHGGATRERVEGQLNHGHGEMQQGVSGIQNHGSYLKSTVFQEQDKGVIRRVGARGIKEAAALIPGYGEAQQK
jgi:conjugal transfer mating pair stabilization protein TraG